MKNKKRAFTLVEVVISLTIGVIVMSLVASLIVIVTNISNKQTYETQCQTEYQQASQFVETYFNNYQLDEFELYSVSQNQVTIKNDNDEFELSFDFEQKKLVAEMIDHTTNQVETLEISLKKIVEIKFSANGNLIVCEYLFNDFPTYSNLVTFGV